MVVAPLVPAAGVEIAGTAEETASSVGAPMEVHAPVVVAAARDCVHTGVHRGARQRAWTERRDLCEGRVARVFLQVRRDWRRVHGRQEELRLGESSLNFHAGQYWRWDAALLRTDSSEILRLVVDNLVGVQYETAELTMARVQTDGNDDAGVRPVMTALLRTSTQMPDEKAETGFLDGASLVHRLSDNERGQGELDSPEIRRSMVDISVGFQCETVELKTVGTQTVDNEDACVRPVTTAPLRLSTETPDEQAARGTLTPTTGATAAERRVFDRAGTDPPESGSSGSEREIRAGPTVLAHYVDSSLEAQRQCSAVGNETGYDEDVTVITHQVGSSFEAEHEAWCDRTERTASPTRHTRQSWTSSLMPW